MSQHKSSQPAPNADRIAALVESMLVPGMEIPSDLWERLATYMELLQRWNQRMNLTAVRDLEEMARVHIAESLHCAQILPAEIKTLLDFGSGAGLPGIPIQLLRQEMAVTLAEAQTKKAIFLREVVRTLGLAQTQVHAGRVEALAPAQQWDAVSLRAVDKMELALVEAARRVRGGGWCVVLTTEALLGNTQACLQEMDWQPARALPGLRQRVVLLGQKPAAAS